LEVNPAYRSLGVSSQQRKKKPGRRRKGELFCGQKKKDRKAVLVALGEYAPARREKRTPLILNEGGAEGATLRKRKEAA